MECLGFTYRIIVNALRLNTCTHLLNMHLPALWIGLGYRCATIEQSSSWVCLSGSSVILWLWLICLLFSPWHRFGNVLLSSSVMVSSIVILNLVLVVRSQHYCTREGYHSASAIQLPALPFILSSLPPLLSCWSLSLRALHSGLSTLHSNPSFVWLSPLEPCASED